LIIGEGGVKFARDIIKWYYIFFLKI
jgi:hypothetical protein